MWTPCRRRKSLCRVGIVCTTAIMVLYVPGYLTLTFGLRSRFQMSSPPQRIEEPVQRTKSSGSEGKTINASDLNGNLQSGVHDDDSELVRIFLNRLSSDRGTRVPNLPDCVHVNSTSASCYNSTCPGQFHPSPEVRLRQILSTRSKAFRSYTSAVISITKNVPFRKYVLTTAVSQNHYEEMQALVKNLITDLFPRLDNYTFVLFDLGLTPEQRKLTERHCRCIVVDFPFDKLPQKYFKGLKCYTWKVFIIRSLIEKSEILIWMDASIRWNPAAPLEPLFRRTREQGLQMWGNAGAISLRVAVSMFDYYGDMTCQYSRFAEVESGIVFYHNQRFTREAVLDPWISCALDESCMCLKDYEKHTVCRYSPPRRDNGCHRFDQASLGIIISKLYLEQRRLVWFPYRPHSVRRGDTIEWFKDGVIPA